MGLIMGMVLVSVLDLNGWLRVLVVSLVAAVGGHLGITYVGRSQDREASPRPAGE